MMTILIIVIVIAALFVLYILSIRPGSGRREQLRVFERTPVAHRGLFNNTDIPENSLPAFKRAAENGFPVELDVQLTADEKLVVFHDSTLKRMCGDERKISDFSYEELRQFRLLDTDERIPLFKDILDLINGSVPIVMEIKPEGDHIRTAELSSAMLKTYKGGVCLESFHPFVLKWYKENDPDVLRGLLSTDFFRDGNDRSLIEKFLLSNLMLNFIAKPDFISYNHKYRGQFSYRLCRALYKPVNAAWTIKSRKELDEAADIFSIFIFDSFLPRRL